MNLENVKAVAEVVRAAEKDVVRGTSEGDGFNMNFYSHSCGTPSCIAGYAAFLANGGNPLPTGVAGMSRIIDTATDFLGISAEDADRLFGPFGYTTDLEDITPDQAATVLDILAATGEVDWESVLEPDPNYGKEEDYDQPWL